MNGCFGCDPANPGGLGMGFFRDAAGRLAASCVPTDLHRGLGRIVNGGLVTTFGEELAAAAAGAKGDGGVVVVRLDVTYKRPAHVGTEMRGIVTSTIQKRSAVEVSVDIESGGQLVAVLNASFLLIAEDRLRELAGIGLDAAPACLVAGRHPLPIEE